MSMLNIANRLFVSLGIRVTRNARVNRFQATEETLRRMAARGFAPAEIIDAGANVGDWTRMARAVFPTATFHMIEPQAGCAPILESMSNDIPRIKYYRTVVTRPGRREVAITGGGTAQRGTGAWVVGEGEEAIAQSMSGATTLDELFGDRLQRPIFLKLDLEGHELQALAGARTLLSRTEAILAEVTFFDIYGLGRPLFSDVLAFLRDQQFELYDIASLSARPRDDRLRQGDAVFVRRDSALLGDRAWE
jgi:FkbM family methyltransferase